MVLTLKQLQERLNKPKLTLSDVIALCNHDHDSRQFAGSRMALMDQRTHSSGPAFSPPPQGGIPIKQGSKPLDPSKSTYMHIGHHPKGEMWVLHEGQFKTKKPGELDLTTGVGKERYKSKYIPHPVAFPEVAGEGSRNPNQNWDRTYQGRYDPKMDAVSISVPTHGKFREIPSVLMKHIEKHWPTASIVPFYSAASSQQFSSEEPSEAVMNFLGFKIRIESPKGSTRSGRSRGGHEWSVKMEYPYGYIVGQNGADGEGLDVYVGPDQRTGCVYIVHQNNPDTGKYDEDKVMLGFIDAESARSAYLKQYDNPDFFGSMTEIPLDTFRNAVANKSGSYRWKKHPQLGLQFSAATHRLSPVKAVQFTSGATMPEVNTMAKLMAHLRGGNENNFVASNEPYNEDEDQEGRPRDLPGILKHHSSTIKGWHEMVQREGTDADANELMPHIDELIADLHPHVLKHEQQQPRDQASELRRRMDEQDFAAKPVVKHYDEQGKYLGKKPDTHNRKADLAEANKQLKHHAAVATKLKKKPAGKSDLFFRVMEKRAGPMPRGAKRPGGQFAAGRIKGKRSAKRKYSPKNIARNKVGSSRVKP